MSNMKDITIDPITEKEAWDIARNAFDDYIEDSQDELIKEFTKHDLLMDLFRNFYMNGFIHGAKAMTDDPDLQETIHMIAEEINYQLKQ